MKYEMSFEESDWEAVLGIDQLYLKQYLFVEGVAHHVEAWRVDDRDPATPPAAIQDQVQLLRRATDPAVIDEPWRTVTIRGLRYGLVITPATDPGAAPDEGARDMNKVQDEWEKMIAEQAAQSQPHPPVSEFERRAWQREMEREEGEEE
jgi:hypothetical protein